MLGAQLLALLATLEDEGALVDVKSTDGMRPQAKLVLDTQSYDVVTSKLAGMLRVDSPIKQVGLGFTIERGDVD